MDIHQLKTFVTVAREGSVTRASSLLHLSQPAVSAHIKAMEDVLGVSLFLRTARGMSLTSDGARLLAKAEQTLAAHDDLLAEALRGKGRVAGKLRLGASSAASHRPSAGCSRGSRSAAPRRDVAEVAALVLSAPEAHRGRSYTLTGPGPVPWSEVTDALSAALGRTIRYEPASVLGYARHLSRRGLPRGAILVQTILHVLLRFRQGATVDPTLERLLGRPGRGVRSYVAEHAALWAKGPR